MSDRIAVMADGRIEQVGTPAEIYEHPDTEFVAGFVGTSNVFERGGRRYTIRPEKLHLLAETEAVPAGMEAEVGVVREVIYLGAVTRYVVELDGGATLTAMRQNLETSAQEALAHRGSRVRLAWRPEQLAPVDAGHGTSSEERS